MVLQECRAVAPDGGFCVGTNYTGRFSVQDILVIFSGFVSLSGLGARYYRVFQMSCAALTFFLAVSSLKGGLISAIFL